ncbi:MAG: S-layer homology domain-containing protein [Clostridia bacterium]|nr:S-layer homology domain-containing protein [Clostridia bacterium]
MNIKKVLLVILVFVFCAASLYTAAASVYDDAIDMVCSLGIMRGYEDGEFRPDGLLTRSEAVVTVSGIMGVIPDTTQSTFYDVPQSHWAKGYIEAAGKAGIVSGVAPGVFQPDSSVTKYQAAVMLSNLMGYGEIVKADKNGETSYNAIIVARGLYDGILGTQDEPITRGGFARMICNALEEPLLDVIVYREDGVSYEVREDVTILTRFLNISKIKGQVTANNVTGLTGGSTTKEGYVKIENNLYNVGGTKIAEKIGRFLTVYLRKGETDEKTVVYYKADDRKSITVSSENIDSYANNVFTYYESEDASSTKSVNVLPVADCLYNGVYKIPQNQDFKPANGSVELYDSDDDGIYDVVYVKSYTLYIADSIDYERKCISDKYNKSILKLDKAKQTDIYLDGRRIDFEDIQEGDVLLVAAEKTVYDNAYPLVDASAEVFEILVSRESVEGTVQAKYKDFFTINDQKYEISNGMKYAITKGEATDIGVGTEAVFLMDAFGKVVMTQKAQSLSAGSKYGYVVDCDKIDEEMGNQRLALKVFDFKLKSTKILYGADRMIIDGESKKTANEQFAAMKRQYSGDVTVDFASRLVIYRLDSEGYVKNIDTDYVSPNENSKETLCYDNNQQTEMYANNVFGGNIAVGEDTIILGVPRTKATNKANQTFAGSSRTYIGNKDQEDYIYFRSSYASNSTKYTVESYNIKDNGEAPIILYYYVPVVKAGVISNESTKNMMIQDVYQVLLDDEMVYEVRGFDGKSYTTLFISAEDSVVADIGMNPDYSAVSTEILPMDLVRGDIVRYSDLRKNSNITLRIERVVARENTFVPNMKHYAQQNSSSSLSRSDYFNAFNVSCGTVLSSSNGIVKINFGSETKVYNLNDAPLCIYDNDTVKQAQLYDLLPDIKVVLLTADGKVVSCYIYK